MAQVTITINSREYSVACEDGQELRIIQLANLLDEKAKMICSGVGQVQENMLLAMVGLLIADELCELKKNNTPSQETSSLDTSRILEIDQMLSSQIKGLNEQLKSVANSINLL